MSRYITYVLAVDPCIGDYCALCEGPIEEAGQAGVWLFRVTFPEIGRIHTDPLCLTCGMEHAPQLIYGLAATWELEHQLRTKTAAVATAEDGNHAIQ